MLKAILTRINTISIDKYGCLDDNLPWPEEPELDEAYVGKQIMLSEDYGVMQGIIAVIIKFSTTDMLCKQYTAIILDGPNKGNDVAISTNEIEYFVCKGV